jgi:hypothetical protein
MKEAEVAESKHELPSESPNSGGLPNHQSPPELATVYTDLLINHKMLHSPPKSPNSGGLPSQFLSKSPRIGGFRGLRGLPNHQSPPELGDLGGERTVNSDFDSATPKNFNALRARRLRREEGKEKRAKGKRNRI